MQEGSMVELIGVVTNNDYKNKTFTVHCAGINKSFVVYCDIFCPVQKGDSLHALCITRLDGTFAVVKPPFVQPASSKTSIIQCFIMALKCTYTTANKLYTTIERMSDNNVVNTLSELAQRWNDCHDPDILLMFGDATMDEVRKLLTWWYKQRNLRRLYLLGLNNKEINACRMTCDQIYDIAIDNPYILSAVPIEKCDGILDRINKPLDETKAVQRYIGNASRIIWKNLHSNGWTCTPTKFIHRQFPDIVKYSDQISGDFKIVSKYGSYYLPHPEKVESKVAEYLIAKRLTDNITYTTPFDTPIDLGNGIVIQRMGAQFTRELAPDQQMAVQGALDHTVCIITGAAGTGKCLDPNTKVLLFDGRKVMVKDLQVGNLLMGPNSQPRRILSTCKGRDIMFRLQSTHGNAIICNRPHVLTLKDFKPRPFNQGYLCYYHGMPYYSTTSEENSEPFDIPLNIYLRDGLKALLYHQQVNYPERFCVDPYQQGFYDGLYQLRIDELYLINSIEVRQKYLAGVIDCIGCTNDECYTLTVKDDDLRNDICTLVYSLGLIPEVKDYTLIIHGETLQLETKIVRRLGISGYYRAEKEFTVKELGVGDYAGFELDGDGRFLLEDGVVTHNTTCIKEIVHNLELRQVNYAICSFTGKAVSRIREVTGKKNPSTMHRLISNSKKDKFDIKSSAFEKDIPLADYEHIIIDETSMVALELFYDLIEAYPNVKKITFVGDCNQLSPISWGNLFGQVVISETIPTYRLTTNYRVFTVDGETDGVILNANAIVSHNPLCKFMFQETNNFQVIEGSIERVYDIVSACASSNIDPSNIVVLSPYNKSLPEINKKFQELYNAQKPYAQTKEGVRWYVGDRVMLTANDPDIGVFNGEIGEVKEITKNGILVEFGQAGCHEFLIEPKQQRMFYQQGTTNRYYNRDKPADEVLDGDEGDMPYERTVYNLALAYALTIDKSQGSEWPFVVLYISEYNTGSFLNRNRIYTAITRTKRCCWIVTSDADALNMAAVKSPSVRHENLAKRLVARLPKMPPFTLPTGDASTDMINDYYATYEFDDEEYYD